MDNSDFRAERQPTTACEDPGYAAFKARIWSFDLTEESVRQIPPRAAGEKPTDLVAAVRWHLARCPRDPAYQGIVLEVAAWEAGRYAVLRFMNTERILCRLLDVPFDCGCLEADFSEAIEAGFASGLAEGKREIERMFDRMSPDGKIQ